MSKFNSVKEFYDYYEGGAIEVGLDVSVIFGIKNLASELEDKNNRDMLFKMSKAYGFGDDVNKLIEILKNSYKDPKYLGYDVSFSGESYVNHAKYRSFILKLFLSLVDYRKLLPEHVYLLGCMEKATCLKTSDSLFFFKSLTSKKRTLRNFLTISGSPWWWRDNANYEDQNKNKYYLKEAIESMSDFENRKEECELLTKIKDLSQAPVLFQEDVKRLIEKYNPKKLMSDYAKLLLSEKIISDSDYEQALKIMDQKPLNPHGFFTRVYGLIYTTTDKKIKSGEWEKENALPNKNITSNKDYNSVEEFFNDFKDNNIKDPFPASAVLNIKNLPSDLKKEENRKLLADISKAMGWNKNLDELVNDIYEEFIPIMPKKFSSIESNPYYRRSVVLKLLLSLAGDKKISLKHIYKLGCISEYFKDETLLAFKSLPDNERTLRGLLSIPICFWINKYESLYRESIDYIDEAFRSIPGFENYEAEYKLLTKITDMFTVYGEKIDEAEKKKLINDYLKLLVSKKIISDADRDQALKKIKHQNLDDPENAIRYISSLICKTTTEKMKSEQWKKENALLNKNKVSNGNYKPVLDSESVFEKRKNRRKALRKTIRYVNSEDEYNNIRDFHDYWIEGDCIIDVYFPASNVLGIKNLARDLETEENRNLLADLSNSYKWNKNLDALVDYINKEIVPKIDKNAKHLGLQEADQIVPPSWKAFILRFFLSMAGNKKISFKHIYMLDCVSAGYPSVNLLFFKSLPDNERTFKNLLSIATFPWDWNCDSPGVNSIEHQKINFIREAVENLCDFNKHKDKYEKMIDLFEKISNRHELSDNELKKVMADYLKLLVSGEVISDDDYQKAFKNIDATDADRIIRDLVYITTDKKIKSGEWEKENAFPGDNAISNDGSVGGAETDADSNTERSYDDKNITPKSDSDIYIGNIKTLGDLLLEPGFFEDTEDKIKNKLESLDQEKLKISAEKQFGDSVDYVNKYVNVLSEVIKINEYDDDATQLQKSGPANLDINKASKSLEAYLDILLAEKIICEKAHDSLKSKVADAMENQGPKGIIFVLQRIKDLIGELINKIIGQHKFSTRSDRNSLRRKNKLKVLSKLSKDITTGSKAVPSRTKTSNLIDKGFIG